MSGKYCRYCEHMNAGKCGKTGKTISEKRAKHSNRCRNFRLNAVDALRKNRKGYQPQLEERRIVTQGHQITMRELINTARKEE